MTTDEEAEFTALVQRQSHFVFRVAYAVLLNSYDAEDTVQEVFLKLYRNAGWQHLDNERAFLARVTWRIAVDRRPRSSAASTLSFDTNAGPAYTGASNSTADPASLAPGPEQTVLFANQHAVVHYLIDGLPEGLRLPLVLSAFDELNSREIAGIVGIPEGTVRTRLQRARLLLRQKLAALQSPQETHHA